jgi:hypothetical protein
MGVKKGTAYFRKAGVLQRSTTKDIQFLLLSERIDYLLFEREKLNTLPSYRYIFADIKI